MLHARVLSYPNAHRYRLDVNDESLPSNRPKCPGHNYRRDGAMKPGARGIQLKQICHFYRADPAYGEGIAKGLGIDVSEIKAGAMAVK